jgi:putative SOS response-associated peptidase YedK
MCTNYRPGARDLLRGHFELPESSWANDAWAEEIWPMGRGPIIHAGGATVGHFGLVPFWAKAGLKFGRHTYNARSETMAEKPSFRDAWKRGQRCLIPAVWFCEPNWETGKAVRWRIHDEHGEPLALAGLWTPWRDAEGGVHPTYTMVTVNADEHALMQRFHRPGEEKRSVVVLRGEEREQWLRGSVVQAQALVKMPEGLGTESLG